MALELVTGRMPSGHPSDAVSDLPDGFGAVHPLAVIVWIIRRMPSGSMAKAAAFPIRRRHPLDAVWIS